MIANGCSMALGDGEGLNILVRARGLVSHLFGHSINQPVATLENERAALDNATAIDGALH
jgi:hypothetical protein